MTTKKLLIYGATSQAGRLLVDEALKQGFQPLLAGSDGQQLLQMAQSTGLSCRIFNLQKRQASQPCKDFNLQGCDLFINCSPPFSCNRLAIAKACAQTKTHYLDLAADLEACDTLYRYQGLWKKLGIWVMPNLNFIALASDFLASLLKRKLPDALSLQIGLQVLGKGSSISALATWGEMLASGGKIRDNNILKTVPSGWKTQLIPYQHENSQLSVTLPLACLATLWAATRIPYIETYVAASSTEVRYLKMARLIKPLLYFPSMRRWVYKHFGLLQSSALLPQAAQGGVILWGRASNARGQHIELRLHTPEPWRLCSEVSLEIAKAALAGHMFSKQQFSGQQFFNQQGGGAPSLASLLGPDFLLQFAGVQLEEPTTPA